jgi:transposase
MECVIMLRYVSPAVAAHLASFNSFAGVDLHKDTMTVCVIEPSSGEVRYVKLACKCRRQIVEFFQSLPRPCVVAIESVGFYRWLWDLLEPVVDKLLLADATGCRRLAGRRIKTDREDAHNVTDLLMCGRLPVAYAPPAPVWELRDWTRHRNYLSRCHARCLHRVKSLMNLNNRPGPARMTADLLARYLKGQGTLLPDRHVRILWHAHDQLSLFERQMDESERELIRLVEQPIFRHVVELIDTMPGVGLITAATVMAEIGDFARFKYRKSIAKYAGFNPLTFDSADKQRVGRMSKAGPRDVRWVMQQASWTAIRQDPAIRRLWQRIAKRAGSKAAAVAVARHMLMWLWNMVRRDQPFRPAKAA